MDKGKMLDDIFKAEVRLNRIAVWQEGVVKGTLDMIRILGIYKNMLELKEIKITDDDVDVLDNILLSINEMKIPEEVKGCGGEDDEA